MDWGNVKTIFLRAQNKFEFQQLKQSSMSAPKYVEKSEDMASNSRKMVYAPDERWEIDQFLFGLRADIYHNVS